MSKRSDIVLLNDILEAILNIEEFLVEFTEDDFYRDKKTKHAVVRNLEIIGEAAQKITKDYKQLNSHVAWREASDLRNKIIHDYSGLDYTLVWEIVRVEIPIVKIKI